MEGPYNNIVSLIMQQNCAVTDQLELEWKQMMTAQVPLDAEFGDAILGGGCEYGSY